MYRIQYKQLLSFGARKCIMFYKEKYSNYPNKNIDS